MNDKAVFNIYTVLSWIIWGLTMSLIVLIVVLFCIGEQQKPVFTLHEQSLTKASQSDEALCALTSTPDGYYCYRAAVSVTGASLSPYTYKASAVALSAPNSLRYSSDVFVLLSKPIQYSKLQTDTFTVSVYFKAASLESAAQICREFAFGLRNVQQSFVIISKTLVISLPNFSVSEYSQTDIPLQTQDIPLITEAP